MHSTLRLPLLDPLGVLLDLMASIMVLLNSTNNAPRSSFLILGSGAGSAKEVLVTF
jgi:hypothetical protein